MTKRTLILLILLNAFCTGMVPAASLLYSRQPAKKWQDALISGNGQQGILVFGDPREDLTVCNRTLMTMDSRDILQMNATMTIVDGELVYEK